MITVNIQAVREAAVHRPAGYLEDVMASGVVDGDFVRIDDKVFDGLMIKYAGYPLPCGPGCQLKRILARFGIVARPGCACEARASLMDSWGINGCAMPDRMREIVSWLKEEASARSLPFVESAAKAMVRAAISAARSHEEMTARKLRELPPPPSSAAV